MSLKTQIRLKRAFREGSASSLFVLRLNLVQKYSPDKSLFLNTLRQKIKKSEKIICRYKELNYI